MERKLLVTKGFGFNEVDNDGEKFARLDDNHFETLTEDVLRELNEDEEITEINDDDRVYKLDEEHLYVTIDVRAYNEDGLYREIIVDYLLSKVAGNSLRTVYEYEYIDEKNIWHQF